ncbi:MAG: DUF4276 family protein [Deltaproteobacteria bacterium]|nr:DUF4276 family protein [Deltaproteobacteria bacterium]
MTGVYIATEDALSEAVADRLIEEENRGIYVAVHLGRKGNDYLKRELRQFKKIARYIPVLLLTDLDRIECPTALIDDWRGRMVLPETMLFRVSVRETEAWLLADREGFAQFSGVPLIRIPNHPESLVDPKEALLNLVRRYGRRSVKADILPARGSTARIGLAYNQALCGFVQESWSLERAAQAADSLDRARRRLHELRLRLEHHQ